MKRSERACNGAFAFPKPKLLSTRKNLFSYFLRLILILREHKSVCTHHFSKLQKVISSQIVAYVLCGRSSQEIDGGYDFQHLDLIAKKRETKSNSGVNPIKLKIL